MSDSFQFLLTSLSCGVGFGLLGALNAVGRRSSLAIRGSVSLAIIGLLSGVAFAAAGSVPAQRVALILIGVYVTLVLVGSSWLANGMSWTLTTLRTPAVSIAAVRPALRRFQRPLNIVIFGLGPQGVGHLDALRDIAARNGDISPPATATYVARRTGRERLPRRAGVTVTGAWRAARR